MEMKDKFNFRELVQKVGITRLIIIVLAGVMLLVLSLPSGGIISEENNQEEKTEDSTDVEEKIALDAMDQYAQKQENATKKILSKVQGIGKVEVMLTLSSSEEKITLQNDDVSNDDTQESSKDGSTHTQTQYQSKSESVLVEREGSEYPYVVQVNSPKIEGVLVVAEGMTSSTMETEIIEAIQALFPIEAHKIKVMKME